jgi:hypothetical protein
MLRVNIKGTGANRVYEFEERVVIGDDGDLIGESGNQSGNLLASAGKVLTVAEVEALGVAAQLAAAVKPAKPKRAEESAAPKPKRRRAKKKA